MLTFDSKLPVTSVFFGQMLVESFEKTILLDSYGWRAQRKFLT